mgnify:CR=1 FL=1|jgi:Transcriptional regulator
MRLRHIEVFHAVKRTGSISGAAQLLGVSQPAASKVLRHAEDQLGFKLFRRIKGRLYPTHEAEILFAEVEKVYRDLEMVRSVARNLRLGTTGHLRVGGLPGLGLGLLPHAISRLRAASPNVTCEVATHHTDALVRSLLAHELDIAIAIDPPPMPGILRTEIGGGQLVYAWNVGMGMPADGPIALRDVDESSLISLKEDDPAGILLRQALEQAGVERVPAIRVQTYYVAMALVERGVGCAIVDEFTAKASAAINVRYRPLDPPVRFTVTALHPEARPLPAVAVEFLSHLKAAHRDIVGPSVAPSP